MSPESWEDLGFKVGTVFRPAQPVKQADLFAGRTSEIRRVVDSINQAGLHAVVFGERGVGKTSLSNMLFPKLSSSSGHPVVIPQINCLQNDEYGNIWRRVFEVSLERIEQLALEFEETDLEYLKLITADTFNDITPDHVRKALAILGKNTIFAAVIDEFDALDSFDARKQFADTLKYLSDRDISATIILVGVAEDVESLIENHRSVERCICQIKIPRMHRNELEEIISKSVAQLGMTIDDGALHEISRLAQGLPHYAHIFGLHAARVAIDRQSVDIKQTDMPDTIDRALLDIQASIKSDYVLATSSARKDALYKQVLLSCALTECDELGYFYPADVAAPFSRIMKSKRKTDSFIRHLNEFSDAKRSEVLEKDERTTKTRYRFRNPMLQPYVLIKGLADHLITEDDLAETRSNEAQKQKKLF